MGKDYFEEKMGKKIFGMAEMRNHQAEVMDIVSNHNEPVFLRDNKRNACSRSAILISPAMCSIILDNYEYDIKKDFSNNEYRLSIENIGANGVGDTLENAIDSLVIDLIEKTRAYFSEMDLHSRLPDTKKLYPWYFKILQCKNEDDIKDAIGSNNII